ncbi:Crp/Fnr family transcriptional regulator [Allorhizocola rhizosphaerae]|uniref:Crp/Fnr family transcriptional regulator n=1 Tax=Allorhizocola rhizosphaerae TaxID=1872709 RepID=UPI001FECC564|nr:Crp/Fnr family transcriptional regulator [Allorhizocola rhizosphaerae]
MTNGVGQEVAVWPPGTYLHRLSPAARDPLLGLGSRRRAAPGDTLLHQGVPENHVILLHAGITKVTVLTSGGSESLLAIRVTGDLLGEMSALNDRPRSATVTACTATTYSVIPRAHFQTYLVKWPEAALALAGVVADRLRWANEFRVEFTAYPAKVRIARVLKKIALAYGRRTRAGIEIGFELTQLELASLCGTAEVTVQKTLRDLRHAGLIITGYRSITVVDLDGLRHAARLPPSAEGVTPHRRPER